MEEIIAQLAYAFRTNGKSFYLVGGTVRDRLLGKMASHHIHCITDARSVEIMDIISANTQPERITSDERLGIQAHYGTRIDIATYRVGDNLTEDLRQRDFTMNAIAQDPVTGEIIDPFGGRCDIERLLIRAVEDPDACFGGDPLRMLRAIRFEQQLNFILEKDTAQAILRQSHKLASVRVARIRDEFARAIVQPSPDYTIRAYVDNDLMRCIIPEMYTLIDVGQSPYHLYDVYEHTLLVMRNVAPRLPLRLAALLHDIGKPRTRSVDEKGRAHFYGHEEIGALMTREILTRLAFSQDMTDYVTRLVRMHMRVNAYRCEWSNAAVRRLSFDAGHALPDILDLAEADLWSDRLVPSSVATYAQVKSHLDHLRSRLHSVANRAVSVQPLKSPLNGDELMQITGRDPGPWIRFIKEYLHNSVVHGRLRSDDKEEARMIVLRILQIATRKR